MTVTLARENLTEETELHWRPIHTDQSEGRKICKKKQLDLESKFTRKEEEKTLARRRRIVPRKRKTFEILSEEKELKGGRRRK